MTELEQDVRAAVSNGIVAELSPDELVDLLRRERASFLNYKHRIEQERADDRDRAQGDVLLRLLTVLDELDRALGQRPQELEADAWAQGVALIHRRLLEMLGDLGVERIGVEGEEFDPAYHEAVIYEVRPGATDRRVKAVVRPGYRLHGRLLRPAQVIIVGPQEAAAPQASSSARPDGTSPEPHNETER